MSIRTFFQSLTSTSTRRQPIRHRRPTERIGVEALEDRSVPAFLAPVDYPVAGFAAVRNIVTADFNGDGRLDLATSAFDQGVPKLSVLLGNGDGTFQPARTSSAAASYSWALAVADFNADGKPDLATDGGVHLGSGDGTFGYALPIPSYFYLLGDAIAAGDLNSDGKVDLAGVAAFWDGGEGFSGSVAVCLGNGDGTFADPWHTWADYVEPKSVGLADFNGDGKLDVTSALGVMLGNGDGTLIGSPLPDAGGVDAADFNGDGKPDLVAGTFIQLGNGDGTFRRGGTYTDVPGYIAIADFNGDGNADLAKTWDVMEIILGNGDGTMRTPSTPADSHVGNAFVAADFNGDGLADLVTNPGHSAFSVLINDGNWPPLGAPSMTIGDRTVTEGNTGTRTATLTVTLSAASTQTITVAWTTANGTAAAGSDYQAASGTLMIPAGQTTGTITILVTGDRLGEPIETFTVNLSSPTNATIADGQGVGTIMDDEPRVSISDVTKAEGRKGQTTLFTFTVTLSDAYDQAVTMSYRTVNGTANASDNDYAARTGTLTFAPGETTKTITIEVKGDGKREADEYFYLDLFGNGTNSLFTKSRGTGTILNDD